MPSFWLQWRHNNMYPHKKFGFRYKCTWKNWLKIEPNTHFYQDLFAKYERDYKFHLSVKFWFIFSKIMMQEHFHVLYVFTVMVEWKPPPYLSTRFTLPPGKGANAVLVFLHQNYCKWCLYSYWKSFCVRIERFRVSKTWRGRYPPLSTFLSRRRYPFVCYQWSARSPLYWHHDKSTLTLFRYLPFLASHFSFETDTIKSGCSPRNWSQDPSHTNPLTTHANQATPVTLPGQRFHTCIIGSMT